MIDWLKRKMQIAARKAAKIEIQRYIDGLRGMTDEEIGVALAFATAIRLQLEQTGILPRAALLGHLPDSEIAAIPRRLNTLIHKLQSNGKAPQAAALMVWLHSMRAILQPELRHLGQEMWAELQRGRMHAIGAIEALPYFMSNVPPHTATELPFVPALLAR